jgi:DNA ligase 1
MLLGNVIDASRRMTETTKRLEKIDILATLLAQLTPNEIDIVVAYLAGMTRQGKIGIGYATVRAAAASPANSATLGILDVDRTLETIATTQGRGAEGRRRELLHGMLAKATGPEQHFLTGLLMGELRQGALEGIMLEALACASRLPADQIRRAVMP